MMFPETVLLLLSFKDISKITYPILYDSIEDCHKRLDQLSKLKNAKDYIVQLTKAQLIEIILNNQNISKISILINTKDKPWHHLDIIWESNYK